MEKKDIADRLIDGLAQFKDSHGGAVLDTVLETYSYRAVETLIGSAVSILICAVILAGVYRWFVRISGTDIEDISAFAFITSLLSVFAGFICVLIMSISVLELVSPLNWAGVNNPKVYMTNDIIRKLK